MSLQGSLRAWNPGDGKSWFLGIGIDDYAHFPKLHNAVKDVQDVHRILLDKYDITEAHSLMLYNHEADEGGIIARLEYLAEHVAPEDKVLIYYSGHGYVNPRTKLAYWIPADAQRNRSADYIPNSTIRDHLAVIHARHILLISDSCFSGTLFLRGGMRSSRAVEELGNIPSRWALCSGRAAEEVEDGVPGTNSPFASSVIEALDQNTHDAWNVSRLIDRVREQTAATTLQVPDGSPLRVAGHKGGQYVFRKKGATASSGGGGPTGVQSEAESVKPRESLVQKEEQPQHVRRSQWRLPVIGGGVAALVIAAYFIFFHGNSTPARLPPGFTVNAFHTTSSVNENLWPADERSRFETAKPVFVYGNIMTPESLTLTIRFQSAEEGIVRHSREVRIGGDTGDPMRLSAYHVFDEAGNYKVILTYGDSLLAEDDFVVVDER